MKLVKLDEVSRGRVSRLAVTKSAVRPESRVVTAVRDGGDKLRLIVWEVSGGSLAAKAVAVTDGTIKEVSVCSASQRRVVTAVRDSGDRLRVIAWDISSDGNSVVRRGTGVGDRVRTVAAGSSDGSVFAAASCRNGDLSVNRWLVDPDGDIHTRSTETFGGATRIDVTSGVSNFVALRDATGDFRLIHFWAPGIIRGGMGTGGDVSTLGVVDSGDGGFAARLYTATASSGPTGVRTGLQGTGRLLIGAGTLKVIAWELASSSIQSKLERRAEGTLDGLDGIAFETCLASANTANLFLTAHKGVGTYRKLLPKNRGKPMVRLIAWRKSGGTISKTAEKTIHGQFDLISLAEAGRQGSRDRFVLAMRDHAQNLRVMLWELQI